MRWIASFLVVTGLAACGLQAAPIRVLILTGSNNHDWRATTPVLKEALERSGRFQVEVETNVPTMTPASFAPYDVLLSHFNTFGAKNNAADWSAETRAAFLEFVRSGKGFVAIHAGSSSYYDWPEYHQIAGATWKNGQTRHNAPHTFTVTATTNTHPVTAGLAPFTATDELWLDVGVQPDATVLATAEGQAVAVATTAGKGRGFALMLGHNPQFMANPGFQLLLVRGTEWAATGQATITAAGTILKSVAAYEYGQSRGPLLEAARLAQQAPREWAPALAALLDGEATLDAKKFACEQLSLIGADAEVPALARRVGDAHLDFAARFALERIPGTASLAALRDALPAAAGETRSGLLHSLGVRGDASAVPAIAKLLPDPAAIDALGLIGDQAALEALASAEPTLPAGLRPQWASATLHAAKRRRAAAVLEKLTATNYPKAVRTAASIQRIALGGAKGGDLALAALAGNDPTLQAAARSALQAGADPALLGQVADRLDTLPATLQEQLLALLAERGGAPALPGVTRAVASADPAVRIAAIDALGRLGDRTSVPVLVAALGRIADPAERKRAAESLFLLRGDGVDAALLSALDAAAPAVRGDLLRALVTRSAPAAVPAFVKAAADPEAEVRREAIRGLNQLGKADAAPGLIALLDGAADSDRAALETALGASCRRAETLEPVRAAARGAKGAQLASLITVLGASASPIALPDLRAFAKAEGLDTKTAAVRALANWPDAAVLDDLVGAAEVTSDVKVKALALRGVARLAPLAKERPRKELSALLARAVAASAREEETALLKSVQASLSGVNLALGGTAVNLDGLAPDLAGGGPAMAIDGNPDTYWDETDNQKLYWLKVTLKRPAKVSGIRILGFAHHSYAPKDFEVLCDGKVVATVTGAAYVENRFSVALPPTACSSVELKITGVHGPSPAIRELEIHGEEEGP